MEAPLDRISHAQKERLAYIEFRAYFLGEITRSDIIRRFGIATAAATRDLALYRSVSNDNIELDPRTKGYVPAKSFKPVFEHPAVRVLSALSQGFGEGIGGQSRPLIPCEIPRQLNYPDISILAPITQAIHRKRVVRIAYHSFSSGRSERDVAPLALANNGLRWHVRAFDRKRLRFLDFVLTRIEASELQPESCVKEHEEAASDIQWSRIVELELVPHPKENHPEIVAMDYGMSKEEPVLKVRVRAALAGYFLRQWSVDCSEDHCLDGPEIRLWLRNPLALYGVESSNLAPGYVSQNKQQI